MNDGRPPTLVSLSLRRCLFRLNPCYAGRCSSTAYGLSKLTGYEFPSVESGGNTLVDAPYDSMVINVGLANPTREDIDSEENWDRGLLELELRVITIRRKQ